MRSLDQEVAGWRRQMFSAGIKSIEVLDELESHLREDVERRIQCGADKNHAFRMAAKQIGEANSLHAEFERMENRERNYMKRSLIISAGIIGILVGMAFVMPAVVQYQHEGAMKNEEPWLFLLGAVLTLGGFGLGCRGLMKSRA